MPVEIQLEPPVGFILRQAAAFRRSLENLIPLWERFSDTLDEIEQEQFATHGHGAWPPLAESTIEQKSKHGFSLDPLIRTGTLEGSFHALTFGPVEFSYGTDVEYAHWHQDGGYVAGRPPQRKVIDLTTDDRRKLERDVVRYVDEAAARTFGRI
jgi:phage gpG-like protein